MQEPSRQLTAPTAQALLVSGGVAGNWVLDPHKSSVRLKNSSMWGLARVNGVFREVSGSGTVTPGGEVSGAVAIAAASVDTKNARRDKHLRSADFFDSANHPDITFTADAIRPSTHGVTVTGVLTIRDRSQVLSFDATAFVEDDDEILLDADIRINRADFGLTWNLLGTVSMDNTISVRAVFTRC